MKDPLEISISDALNLQDGTIVPAIHGVVKLAGPIEHRTRPNGEAYTSQIFILGDGVNKINGTIYDHISLANYIGKEILLLSMKSRNGRYGGVTIKSLSVGSLFNKKSIGALSVSKAASVQPIV